VGWGEVSLILSSREVMLRVGFFAISVFYSERIGHPRRGGKPEFKLERYPPLDEPACSVSSFSW
jgi:hypothetical protein